MVEPIDYVLITAAKNEAEYIRYTLDSVLSQTIQPVQWTLVSDHCTDSTYDIIHEYKQQHPFIHLLKSDEQQQRDFSSKVFALQLAIQTMKTLKVHCVIENQGSPP